MSKQTINIGAAPNDGTGDPIRTAYDKTNQNFTELYNSTNNYYYVTTIGALQSYLAGLGNVDVNIFFPAGSYSVSSTISIATKANVNIEGYGATIANTFAGAGNIFTISTVGSLSIRGLVVDLGLNTQQVDAFNINGVAGHSNIINVTVKNYGNALQAGLRLQNVPSASANGQNFAEPGLTISNCNFKNSINYATFDYNANNAKGIGIYMTDTSEFCKIVNCDFSCLSVALWLINGANMMITNCSFEDCLPRISGTDYGVVYVIDGGTNGGKIFIGTCLFAHNWGYPINSSYSTASRPIHVDHCMLAANAVTAITMSSTSTFNRITNNTFDRVNTSSTAVNNPYSAVVTNYVNLNNSSNNIIESNSFFTGTANSGTYVKTGGSSVNNVIRNNTFQSGTELLSLASTTDFVFGNNTGASIYTTTATAAGTTTMDSSFSEVQYWTGATTQTVKLPVVTTLYNGKSYRIVNLSSGVVTLQTSGAVTVKALAANSYIDIWVVNVAGGTGTASWNWFYNSSINN